MLRKTLAACALCAALLGGAVLAGCAAQASGNEGFAQVDTAFVQSNQATAKIVDARTFKEFSSYEEAEAGKGAGHITGAINLDAAHFEDPNGTYGTLEDAQRIFKNKGMLPDETVIVYADLDDERANVVARKLVEAGYANVNVYTEGFGAWASDPANSVEVGSASCCSV